MISLKWPSGFIDPRDKYWLKHPHVLPNLCSYFSPETGFLLFPSQRISYLSCSKLVVFLQSQHCFPPCCCKHQRQEKWLWLYKSIKPCAQTAINKLKRCLEIQTTCYKAVTKGSAAQSCFWLPLWRKYFLKKCEIALWGSDDFWIFLGKKLLPNSV